MTTRKMTDAGIERMVSVLLRTGVVISGSVVLGGGILYLIAHGDDPVDYHVFHAQAAVDSLLGQIVRGAIALRSRSIIQLGLLFLIATPIARVAFSLFGFAFERDHTYVVITAIVLAVLLFGLAHGVVGA